VISVFIDHDAIRRSMAAFSPSSKVEPNQRIEPDRVFFPEGHRGVLDGRRQLVVGNRGMGKSFWTHTLLSAELRERLAKAYSLPALSKTEVAVGFNGSDKLHRVAPTIDEIVGAYGNDNDADLIWRAVLLRAARSTDPKQEDTPFSTALEEVRASPGLYSKVLTEADERFHREGRQLVIVFDALDRLARDWPAIRALTKALLMRAVGLQSFHAIRAKIFMRVDQFADDDLFRFPDSSKIKNDRVNLTWPAHELYGLLFFEMLRSPDARESIEALADSVNATGALPSGARLHTLRLSEQDALVTALAGEFMGGHKKRGRVYTWVPLHLSDAANNCSPRTFLTAWKSAADHIPAPKDKAVDHLGIIEGVRRASSTRMAELREDYPWIDAALQPLHRQFVPMPREELFALWEHHNVVDTIVTHAARDHLLAPIDLFLDETPGALLNTMTRIAVMEERANGKINVPDIFRVESEILRKGGVAVPKRN
jgi:hypothetical protein